LFLECPWFPHFPVLEGGVNAHVHDFPSEQNAPSVALELGPPVGRTDAGGLVVALEVGFDALDLGQDLDLVVGQVRKRVGLLGDAPAALILEVAVVDERPYDLAHVGLVLLAQPLVGLGFALPVDENVDAEGILEGGLPVLLNL